MKTNNYPPFYIIGGAAAQKYAQFGKTTVVGRPGQAAELARVCRRRREGRPSEVI
jgi:hypothetical protein